MTKYIADDHLNRARLLFVVPELQISMHVYQWF
jgi:hypothetical protein